MNITQNKLANELKTVFVNCPGSKCASVQLWFRTGSAKEKAQNRGIAHFLEHMFFKGTESRPGFQLAHEVESFGGEINAFTSFDYTCYYISTPNNKIPESLHILMDMLSNPVFKEQDILTEREVVLEEYKRSIDNNDQFNFMELQRHFFASGYKHPILGTPKNINSFSRQQLVEYRQQNYSTDNALLIVAGEIKKTAPLEKIIESYQLPTNPTSKPVKFALDKKASLAIHSKDVEETSITMVITAPSYEATESSAEDLAITTMFYGDSSPFYKKLVMESTIATNVSASTMYFNDGGAHFIKIVFPFKNLKKVQSLFVQTLAECFDQKPDDKTIQKIKNQYLASKIYSKESIESFAFSLGHGFAQNGDIHSEEHFLEKIKNTSKIDIHHSIDQIFKRSIQFQMQVPKAQADKASEKQLQEFKDQIAKVANKKLGQSKINFTSSNFDQEVKLVQLKKGIQFVYRHSPLTPTFVLHSYVSGGVAFENPKNNGIYHLIGRLFGYGPKDMSYEEYKYELENRSAQISGFSGKHAYGLTAHGQSEHFEFLTDKFFDTLLTPAFSKEYLKLEVELIKRTLESAKKDPVKQCFKHFTKVVFAGHPYQQDILGTAKTLEKMNSKQLHALNAQSLKDSSIVITYCGDLPFEYVYNKVKDRLASLPVRTKLKSTGKVKGTAHGEKVVMDFDREQTHLMIGRPAYGVGINDNLLLKMFNTLLSGQSSRLFVEIRDEKSLCYTTQPIHYTALEGGYWGIYIGTSTAKKDQAIQAILDLINSYKDHGISNAEFDRVKKIIDGQNQINIQTIDDYANFYSIPVLHGLGIDYQHKCFEWMRNVQTQEFNQFLKRFLNYDWNIIEVGKQA